MSTVFISYSRKDREFVRWLNGALTAHDKKAWVDWNDIQPTATWLSEIFLAIEANDNFAFVITEDSLSSKMCQTEIAHASENNKRVIPILLRPVNHTSLPPAIAGLQWLDFTGDRSERAVQVLIDTIDTNPEWVRHHTRLLLRALDWGRQGRDSSFLLRGIDLQEAVRWLSQGVAIVKPKPTTLHEEYIQASQQWETQEIERLNELVEEKERQREEAERQRRIAVAGRLAAQAELTRTQDAHLLERSVLLALESMSRSVSLEADRALRRGLALLPQLPVMRLAHLEEVFDLKYSPDGRYIATGARDGASLWNAKTGNKLIHLSHQGFVGSVAFSPGGRYLATANSDHPRLSEAHVWEIPGGREICRMAYRESVSTLAFSPDGKYLATTSFDNTAQVWEVSRACQVAFETYSETVCAAAFSPDGRHLAIAGDDHTCRIWDAETWRERASLTHGDKVTSVAFSPNGQHLATGSRDKTARLWDVGTWRESACLIHTHIVSSLVFSPHGECLATVAGKTAHVWGTPGGREIARLMNDKILRHVLAFSPDGKHLAGNVDGAMRVWEVVSGLPIFVFPLDAIAASFSPDGDRLAAVPMSRSEALVFEEVTTPRGLLRHRDWLSHVAFSSDGQYLATASRDNTACIWQTKQSRPVARVDHGDWVDRVTFSPDGRYLATAGKDRTAGVWEVRTGRAIALMPHESPVSSVVFSPNGKYLATVARKDCNVHLWVLGKSREFAILHHPEPAKEVVFSPNGRSLATASEDPIARVWELRTASELVRMEHDDHLLPGWAVEGKQMWPKTYHAGVIHQLAFNPDGNWLATASGDRTARVWDVTSGREIVRFSHPNDVRYAIFSPNGAYLATYGSFDVSVWIWEVATATPTRIYLEGVPRAIAFSPCGHYLATGGDDRAARVWAVPSGRELIHIDHSAPVVSVAFSPDGRYLATASWDSTAKINLCRPEDLMPEAIARLTRNLTEQEWRQYLGDEPYNRTCPHLPAVRWNETEIRPS